MIPRQLNLKNFLSYRQATLDFRGLHTACICGANGAGKSSLLEAITWVIWGQTRTATEEDVIHSGEKNVRVDFEFIYNYQTYRVIRTRQRRGGSTLDFQIENEGKFNSISAKGIRATQELIIECLKLDYDTFINSAYLRQGRADEFMLRRPSERKQILADLLKLNQYEDLATQAKDLAKQYKVKGDELEHNLQEIEIKLQGRETISDDLTNLNQELKQLQATEKKAQEKLQKLQAISHQRQSWEERLNWHQNHHNNLSKKCDQIREERQVVQTQLNQLETILNDAEAINLGYQQLQQLQQEEANLRDKFQAYQEALQHKQELEQQLQQKSANLTLAIQREKTNLENLENQKKDLETVIQEREGIQEPLQKLSHYRQRLNELDQVQHQVAPLQQRCLTLQTDIERQAAKLQAKLEQLQEQENHLGEVLAKVPEKRKELLIIEEKIEELNKKSNYQKRVEEKGLEQKSLKQRYEENQQNLAKNLEELQQKLNLLAEEHALCPLCEQELDDSHRNHVIEKTLNEQKQIESQSWRYGEEIINCERELINLRSEYENLRKELSIEDSLKQKYAKLEDQLDASGDTYTQLREIRTEKEAIENLLSSENYAQELRHELQVLKQQITSLNYDDKTHSLVRQEEKRWRWAEIKQAKIEDAQRKYDKIKLEEPQKLQQITALETQLSQLTETSPLQQQIREKEKYLHELNYDAKQHNQVRDTLQKIQSYQLKYTELKQAEKHYPQLQKKSENLVAELKSLEQEKVSIAEQLQTISNQIEQFADCRQEIQTLEEECVNRQQKIAEFFTKKGGLEQSLTNLDNLQIKYENISNRLGEVRKNYRIYQELGQAFGKNGIQALMIENVLPQLEAEANQILARLTGNQLHVQFKTQKERATRSKKQSAKLIDTLDIIISDVKGTRSYETYSGGESFRINFSVRLALAKLLAQRAGTSLQFLIVDEGFGTQDSEGCDRLIAALNAISADFACILTVTHMPQFKEAFQTRIEINKTDLGSQIRLST